MAHILQSQSAKNDKNENNTTLDQKEVFFITKSLITLLYICIALSKNV